MVLACREAIVLETATCALPNQLVLGLGGNKALILSKLRSGRTSRISEESEGRGSFYIDVHTRLLSEKVKATGKVVKRKNFMPGQPNNRTSTFQSYRKVGRTFRRIKGCGYELSMGGGSAYILHDGVK